MISIESDVLWWERCDACDGNGGRNLPDGFCDNCSGQGEVPVDLSRIATLAHNLAIGAGLSRAHWLGYDYGYQSCSCGEPLSDEEHERIADRYFHPGCGRSAP